jgi:hypothetical protein
MLSRSAFVALCFTGLVLFPTCQTREMRLTDICDTLFGCSRYVDAQVCEKTIEDALKDQRTSDSDVARCGVCLGHHDYGSDGDLPTGAAGAPGGDDLSAGDDEPEDCSDLIRERDCDASCENVPVVLRVRTTEHMRAEACQAVSAICALSQSVRSCARQVEAAFVDPELDLERQLLLDAEMEACRICVVAPGRLPSDGLVADGKPCALLIDACQDSCRKVTPIAQGLELAGAVIQVCDKVDSCFEGASNTAGAGGEGGAPSGALESCFQRLLAGVGAESGPSAAGGAASTDAAGGAGGAAVLDARELLTECSQCVGSLSECPAEDSSCHEKCRQLWESQ